MPDNQPPLLPQRFELPSDCYLLRISNFSYAIIKGNSQIGCVQRDSARSFATSMNPDPASPVTRSGEVTEAINMIIGGERAHPLSEKWRKILLAYFVQLEGSAPTADLREALEAGLRCAEQCARDHMGYEADKAQIEDAIAQLEASQPKSIEAHDE